MARPAPVPAEGALEAGLEFDRLPSAGSSEETVPSAKGPLSIASAALHVPHRMQTVQVGWTFIAASLLLTLHFASLQDLVHHRTSPGGFAELCNWFGVVSSVLWFLGFGVHTHWLHSVGATRTGLIGSYVRLLACIILNIQPMTATMNDPRLGGGVSRGGGAGTWWSNLVAIIVFHMGNLIGCADFYLFTPPGANKEKGWLYHGNLPITVLWTFQTATLCLVVAIAMSCTYGGTKPAVPVSSAEVTLFQFAGCFFALLGSCILTVWCDGFRNFAHGAPASEAAAAAK